MNNNPLLAAWNTAYGLPPFDLVTPAHFAPAFDAALKEHRAEIDALAAMTDAPTFENTLVPFDKGGRLLARIRDQIGRAHV